MEAIESSETSVLIRTTRRNIPGDAILHSHRRENLKSYIILQYAYKLETLVADPKPEMFDVLLSF
jgi:hypothetical protein